MRTPWKCVPAGPDASDDQDDGQPLQESAGHGEEVRGIDRLEQKEKNYKTKNEKKSNRFRQALDLPILCNLNPRSIYNKTDEFHELVKEEDIDVVFLSESWEREYLPLDQIIQLEDHVVIFKCSPEEGYGG